MIQPVQSYVMTPLGRVRLVTDGEALVGAYLPQHCKPTWPEVPECADHRVLAQAAQELREYFAGERRIFDTVVAPQGTQFQRLVWQALRAIPYGARHSYSSIAEKISQPRSTRAVGTAIGRNPISIFIPCHRVVGKDGNLTGYAGGLDAKRWLLAHELDPVLEVKTARLFEDC